MKKVLIIFIGLTLFSACRKSATEPEAVVIGSISVDLDANEQEVRTKEALAGNFTTDALRYYWESKGQSFDCVFINGGAIRFDPASRPDGIYKQGNVTNIDMEEMLPFGEVPEIVEVTGEELKQIFERSIAQYPEAKGPFLQVSENVQIHYDTLGQSQVINPLTSNIVTPGQRVVDIIINGASVQSSDVFRVMVPGFISEGNDGYIAFKNIPDSRKTKLTDFSSNALKDYVIVHTPVAINYSDRIIFE